MQDKKSVDSKGKGHSKSKPVDKSTSRPSKVRFEQ